MQGKKPDEDIRLPMQWNAEINAGFTSGTPWRAPDINYQEINVSAQDQDPNSLLNHYRSLINLRINHQALRTGNISLLETGNSGVYAALRSEGDEFILIVVNLKGIAISEY